jgi:hypothetical protein
MQRKSLGQAGRVIEGVVVALGVEAADLVGFAVEEVGEGGGRVDLDWWRGSRCVPFYSSFRYTHTHTVHTARIMQIRMAHTRCSFGFMFFL